MAILETDGEKMDLLPRYEEAVIPIEKFTKYALNYDKQPDKAFAFELALGYTLDNVDKLIANIKANLDKFPVMPKGNKGFGETYEVIMFLTGENGKTAKVLTAWLDDDLTGQMRMVSAYVDE